MSWKLLKKCYPVESNKWEGVLKSKAYYLEDCKKNRYKKLVREKVNWKGKESAKYWWRLMRISTVTGIWGVMFPWGQILECQSLKEPHFLPPTFPLCNNNEILV